MFKFTPGRVCLNTGAVAVRIILKVVLWFMLSHEPLRENAQFLSKGVSESAFKIWFICGCVTTNKPEPYSESVIVDISSLMPSWAHPMPAAVLGRASQEKCYTIVPRKGLSRSISGVRWSRVFLIPVEHVEVNNSGILNWMSVSWFSSV